MAPNKPKKRPYHDGETGEMPRVDEDLPFASEPPQPRSLPELDDTGSSTGVVSIVTEGEDEAKHADDSANASSSDSKPRS